MMVHPNFVHFATGWPGCETHGLVCFDSYILAGSEYEVEWVLFFGVSLAFGPPEGEGSD